MSEHRRLLKSASVITFFTIVSRIFGYVRDSRIVFLLGAGTAADAFTTAYRIPNLLRRLVGEGAVSGAFIPVFSRYLTEEKKEDAWQFANVVLTVLTILLTVVTIAGIVLSPLIVRLFATGFTATPGKLELTAMLNRVMFPYIFLISMSALAMGILNSFHRFAAPAFAPVLLNLSIIAVSFFADLFPNPSMALAAGVIVGGVLQVGVQLPALFSVGWRPRLQLNRSHPFSHLFSHPGVRRLGKLMVPVLLGAGIVQVNILVGVQFASYLQEGSVTSIYLADRVMELVLGAYAIAISTAVLPLMSRQAAAQTIDGLKVTLNFAARIVLFITVPATVGLIVLRKELIEVLFQHGGFSAASTALTAWALLFFALGLSAFSMVKVIVSAFYALQDTRTPMKVAFSAMLINVVLNFLLIGPLQNGGPPLAATLSAYFNAAVLLVFFRKRYGLMGAGGILQSLAKFIGASAALGVVAFFLIRLPGFYEGGSMAQKAAALGVTIVAAAGTYFALAWKFCLREAQELWQVRSKGEAFSD